MPVKAYDGLLHPVIEVVRGEEILSAYVRMCGRELNKKLVVSLHGIFGKRVVH